MGFLQAAFINKNTSELRKKLKEIGYKPCHQMTLHPDDNNNLFVDNIFSDSYYSYDEENMTIFKDDINTAIRKGKLVECGDNEDLFLAIVALRDDVDKNQWFVNDNHIWYHCKDNKFREEIANWTSTIMPYPWHKATVEELIEHFKNE